MSRKSMDRYIQDNLPVITRKSNLPLNVLDRELAHLDVQSFIMPGILRSIKCYKKVDRIVSKSVQRSRIWNNDLFLHKES